MRNWLYLLISLAGVAYSAPPAKVEVAYDIVRDGSTLAVVVDRLEHGDGKYRLTETWRGKGLLALRGEIRRTSRGNVAAGGLQPVEFLDERPGRKTSRASFDWTAMTLTMQFRGDPETVQMPPNAQDRLSFMIAFAFTPLDRPVSFSVADGGSVSRYVFDVVGEERVKTPAGEFESVKLARRKDGPDDRRTTEIWLARSGGLIPVRMLVTEKDGTQIDQLATRISAP